MSDDQLADLGYFAVIAMIGIGIAIMVLKIYLH